MTRKTPLSVVICLVFAISASTSCAEEKAASVEKIESATWSAKIGQQVALLIGIDKYQHFTPLPNCVFDCKALAQTLRSKCGFSKITEVYDAAATEENILKALRNLAETLTQEQSLLVFFSGHGTKNDLTEDAYWVPVDGKTEVDFIPSDRIQRYVKAMKARHIWLVCDSCFSGNLFTEKEVSVRPADPQGLDRYAEENLKKQSRLIMTSGGDEPVTSDGYDGHSIFTYNFLRALDSPESGWTDSSQIFNQIKVDVANNAHQTPQLGAIHGTNHQRGEFILVARSQPKGKVTGYLVDQQDEPLRNYHVKLINGEDKDKTSIRGYFSLSEPVGSYPGLEVKNESGFSLSPVMGRIDVENKQTFDIGRIRISLNTPTPLPTETPLPTPTPAIPDTITNSIGMKLKLIPAGEFMMGSPDSDSDADSDEKPQHRVVIDKPFYIGIYEVTQGQWEEVMANNPSDEDYGIGDNFPVYLSWEECQEFLKKLSSKEGETYRLPTEAEWEYACRAGSATKYCFGEDESRLGDYAWYDENSDSKTHPVGQKKPNAWGLYDMHGNVWEWCQDWYQSDFYKSLSNNASSPLCNIRNSGYRVMRGGGWDNGARLCRSAYRDGDFPSIGGYDIGFRVVRLP